MGLRNFFKKLVSKSSGDATLIIAVSEYIEKWIGPIHLVFHEQTSTFVHVDVYWILPQENLPFNILVTSGMAQRAMRTPAGSETCTHAELVMFLPPGWDLGNELDGKAVWPITSIQAMARYPHLNKTWLWFGHSVPLVSENALPFVAEMLTLPYLLDPDTPLMLDDGREIHFFAQVCLRPEELAYKLEYGMQELLAVAEEGDRIEEFLVVNPGRPSILTGVQG